MLDRQVVSHEVNPVLDIRTLKLQFIDYCRNVLEYPDSTMKTRRTHLKQIADYMEARGIRDVRELNMIALDDYFTYYRQGHAVSTTNTSKRIIKVWLAWLRDYKELPLMLNPDTIRSKKDADLTPKHISKDIIKQVITDSNEQDSLLIATCYEAGLRIAELVAIKPSDIGSDTIRVTGKGRVERTAYVSQELASRLKEFAAGREHVFQTNPLWGGGQISIKTARTRIQNAFLRQGTVMTPHWLRHSLAVHLLEAGCDLVTIQRVLGHKDIQTTMVYLRIADNTVKANRNKYLPSVLA